MTRALLVVVLVLSLSSVALAHWSATGSGTGDAAVVSGTAPLTIAPGAPSGQLIPTGSPTADLKITVRNPNPFSVHVSKLTLDTSYGSGGFSANAVGCALSFATQTNGGAGWDVPAGATIALTLANAMTMGTGAANTCQGETFEVFVEAT